MVDMGVGSGVLGVYIIILILGVGLVVDMGVGSGVLGVYITY